MTPKAFQKLALSFPEAFEAPHFERTSFRVGKKIFATMARDGSEAMVPVADPERLDALLESSPEVFFSYGKWTTRNGSLGVRLPKAGAVLMKELMTNAWRRIAPKSAQAALGTPTRAPRATKKSAR